MPKLDTEWAQRLYLLWVNIGIALAAQLLEQGLFSEAGEVLEKLLDREEENERVYCLVMEYWGLHGDVVRVVRCFSDLENVLAQFGVKPSAKALRILCLYSGE